MSEFEETKPLGTDYLVPAYPSIWQAIKLLGIYLLISFALSIAAGVLNLILPIPYMNQIMGILAGIISFGILLLLVRKKPGDPLKGLFARNNFSIVNILPLIFIIVGSNILLSELDNIIQTFIPMGNLFVEIFRDMVEGQSIFLSFFYVAIMAPVVEEIIFRGIMLRGFVKNYSTVKAVTASAILFGLFHFNLWQFTGAVTFGIIAGWLYVKTRSIIPCIIGHGLHNSMPYIVGSFIKAEIPGYTLRGEDTVLHQPLWFNAIGIALLALGILILALQFRKVQAYEGTDYRGDSESVRERLKSDRIKVAIGMYSMAMILAFYTLIGSRWFSDKIAPFYKNLYNLRKTVPQSSDIRLLESIKFYREMGFFKGQEGFADEELAEEVRWRIAEEYGADWDPFEPTGGDDSLADLDLLEWDTERTWYYNLDVGVAMGENAYAGIIKEWSDISRGVFNPVDITETWQGEEGPVDIGFTLNGQRQTIKAEYYNDLLDVSTLKQINRIIKDTGYQFEFVQVGGAVFITMLTADEREKIQSQRGIQFTR